MTIKQQTTVLSSQGTAATAAAMETGMTNRPNDDDHAAEPCNAAPPVGAKQILSDLVAMVARSGLEG
jgi:hypothetical protein